MHDGEARFTRISSLIDQEPPINGDPGGRTGALGRLCKVLVQEVSAVGAGMTVRVDNGPSLVVATCGPHAARRRSTTVVH